MARASDDQLYASGGERSRGEILQKAKHDRFGGVTGDVLVWLMI